jgi:hypothetical protein
MCNLIEGIRICPNDLSFSLSETYFYRNEGDPLSFTYRFSASFSGGGFSSSNSSEEKVALVAHQNVVTLSPQLQSQHPNQNWNGSSGRRTVHWF